MSPHWLDAFDESSIDWVALEQTCPHYTAMRNCIQDPMHHAEGDVWTHTRMVADALPCYGSTTLTRNLVALFHDVEKPSTRTDIDGRISHPHHARYGAQTAWRELWDAGAALSVRLNVYAIILWHQKVFHMWEDTAERPFTYDGLDRRIQTFSALGSWDDMIAFARADNAGRICDDPTVAETNFLLLQDYVSENLITLSDASRFAYLRRADRSKHYAERHPTGSRVTIMSGLPGSGKDTYIAEHHDCPVISLDDIRREMNVDPVNDNKGRGHVIQEALERAKEHLRRKQNFVWNTTGLTRLARSKIISLSADYDGHVTIEALDRPKATILKQNRDREHAVPTHVITDLVRKWEPPTLLEAHCVRWV